MARIPGIGDRLGPYVIQRQLGAGGMGVVFEATEEGLGRRVALKVLSVQLADQAEFRARFMREASVLARSDSPHIIQVYSHGEQDGCLYLATQFVRGGDLAARVEAEGVPPPGTALDIAAQVASALADAHAVGVVHRDVKPHNVLLRAAEGEVHAYLCDFGIARDDDSQLTQSGVVAGTYAYLAPERVRGEPASPANDIYALGCLTWFLLSGRAPYDGGLVQLAHQHEFGAIPQLPDGPEVLNAFLRRAMAKDPAARHPSAAAAAADLRAIRRSGAIPTDRFAVPPPAAPVDLRSQPSPLPPLPPLPSTSPVPPTSPVPLVSPPPPPPPFHDTPSATLMEAEERRRRPLLIGAAVLLAVLLGVGGGVAWNLTRDDDGGTGDAAGAGSTGSRSGGDATEATGPGPDTRPVTAADADGDGRDDTVLVDNLLDRTLLLPGDADSASGFRDPQEWWGTAYGDARIVRGDFTGDGWADLGLVEGDRVRIARSYGGGFAGPTRWLQPGLPTEFRVTSGDFDGDGRDDLAFAVQDGGAVRIEVALSRGDRFAAAVPWASVDGWLLANMKPGAGDFTGDGRADYVEQGRPPGGGLDVRLLVSEGDGFAADVEAFSTPDWAWAETHPMIGDFDGDGVADVVVRRDLDGDVQFVRLLTEAGVLRVDAGVIDVADLSGADVGAVAADADGDGVSDIVVLDRTGGEVRLLGFEDGQAGGAPFALPDDSRRLSLVGVSR